MPDWLTIPKMLSFCDHLKARATPYDRLLKKEGLPVIRGYFLEDILTAKLKPWKRTGVRGCCLNLGDQQETDAYIYEIPPSGKTLPQRHLFESIVYVARGRGSTTFWLKKSSKITLEWRRGAAFAIPLNVAYQHFNASANEPARFIAATTLPRMLNLFHNEDFIFRNPFAFSDRFRASAGYFRKNLRTAVRRREANFIPDVNAFPLDDYPMKGEGVKIMRFTLAESTIGCHIQEFPLGSRSLLHCHGPGALVIVTKGEGYALLWREGDKIKRYDVRVGSVYSPGNLMFHGHFNTGREAMRHFAVRGASPKYTLLDRFRNPLYRMIPLKEEPPDIQRDFLKELERKGIRAKTSIIKE